MVEDSAFSLSQGFNKYVSLITNSATELVEEIWHVVLLRSEIINLSLVFQARFRDYCGKDYSAECIGSKLEGIF